MLEKSQEFSRARATFEMARADAGEDVHSDDEFALLDMALANATRELLMARAPHFAALAYKLEVFRDQEVYHARRDRVIEILDALIADTTDLHRRRPTAGKRQQG